jgi:hypothetical protein
VFVPHVSQVATLHQRRLCIREQPILRGPGLSLFGEGHRGPVLRRSLSCGLLPVNGLRAPLERGSNRVRRTGAGVRAIMEGPLRPGRSAGVSANDGGEAIARAGRFTGNNRAEHRRNIYVLSWIRTPALKRIVDHVFALTGAFVVGPGYSHGPTMTPFQQMRTEHECLAMALEMEMRAEQSVSPHQSAEFLYLATCWRRLVRQAAWQDAASA